MGTGGEQGIVDAHGSAPATAPQPPDVPDRVAVHVPRGGRVLVVSDLHLAGRASAGSAVVEGALAHALDAVSGPAIVVLAGDCFEMLAGAQLDPGPALDAHPLLTGSLAAWGARADRSVVVLPGNHDAPLGWHPAAATTVRRRLGATVAFAVDIELHCQAGARVVRVEHGHQIDPANSFIDPRDPAETPLGHHVVTDLLPLARGLTRDGWAEGLELMADPLDLAPVVSSRFAYRRLGPALAWAALPWAVTVGLVLAAAVGAPSWVATAALAALSLAVVVAVAVVGGALFWGGLGWRSLRAMSVDMSGGVEPGNDAPRRRTSVLAAQGVHAYVSGHTHIAELTAVGGALYANSGCGGGLLHRRPGRGPLPDAFSIARHVSWIELEAGAGLVARLVVGFEEVVPPGRLERWATRPAAPAPVTPTVIRELSPLGVPAHPVLVT